jgi:predicted acyl esterase
MIHGVNDNAARIPGAEWFFAQRFNRPGDKLWLGQWNHGSGSSRCGPAHPNCRMDQWTYALHAWFDHHLMQTGVDTGPSVEVFLSGETPSSATGPFDQEQAKVYTDDGWSRPPARKDLYLDATNMSLSFQPPTASGSASFRGTVSAVIASALPSQLTFAGQPLERDTLFLGLPRMQLNASVTNAAVNHLTVTLYREDADGEREAINYCAIQPQLRDGVHTISPVVPGQEMALPMQCFTMAHWVPAGQHLELEVSNRTPHHASFGNDANVTVLTGPQRSSYLLPEVPEFTLFEDDVPLQEGT